MRLELLGIDHWIGEAEALITGNRLEELLQLATKPCESQPAACWRAAPQLLDPNCQEESETKKNTPNITQQGPLLNEVQSETISSSDRQRQVRRPTILVAQPASRQQGQCWFEILYSTEGYF